MKKVFLVAVMFMLFVGVVSASSINGDYKGNPIVSVTSGGVVVSPQDVPAMIFDGRTVVPLNLLAKMGANVVWNADNYSVNVDFPNNGLDTEVIISLSNLVSLGKDIMDFSDLIIGASIASSKVKTDDGIDILSSFYSHLNWMINSYNELQKQYSTSISKKNNIPAGYSNVFNNYFKNIDAWKAALNALSDYHKSSLESDYSKYLLNDKDAAMNTVSNLKLANDLLDNYIRKNTNYVTNSPSPTTVLPTPTPTPSIPLTTGTTVESQIDGEFKGWDGETIFKLMNGQIWQQSEYAYMYSYSYMPDVTIYLTSGGYTMKVDGVDETITVKRIK